MNDTESLQQIPGPEKCISCGSPAVLKGFPNALCESCRESFIKYPIPGWIKIFAAVIGAILIFSLYKIPGNLSVGMHLDKGETAIELNKYNTAEKELKTALNRIPGNLEMQSELMMASFYNEDYGAYDSMMKIIGTKNFEDQDLFTRVQAVVNESVHIIPGETFQPLLVQYGNNFDNIPDTTLENYIKENPSDLCVETVFAGRLSDKKNFAGSDTLLENVLRDDMEYVPALQLMAGNKRIESDPAASLDYCNRILKINKESINGLASKARTFLTMKKDKEAAGLTDSALALDQTNSYAMCTRALVYHFANNIKGRDELMNKISDLHDSSADESLQYVKDIINGKEKFRN